MQASRTVIHKTFAQEAKTIIIIRKHALRKPCFNFIKEEMLRNVTLTLYLYNDSNYVFMLEMAT